MLISFLNEIFPLWNLYKLVCSNDLVHQCTTTIAPLELFFFFLSLHIPLKLYFLLAYFLLYLTFPFSIFMFVCFSYSYFRTDRSYLFMSCFPLHFNFRTLLYFTFASKFCTSLKSYNFCLV